MIVSLQYLRAAAAALVVAFHIAAAIGVYHTLPAFLTKGAFGVDLFFVISGFIMWHNTAGTGIRPATFIGHRLARIVPLYWLVTVAMFSLALVSNSFGAQHARTAADLAASLLFFPIGDWTVYMPVYEPGWTINYEMFFYALFAAGLLVRNDGVRAVLLLTALAACVMAGLVWPTKHPVGWYTAPIILEFAAGVVLAIAYARRAAITPFAAAAMLAAGVLIILFVSNHEPHIPGLPGTRVLNWGVPAALIVGGALFLERAGLVRRYEGLILLGDASYSLYLTHVFAIFAMEIVWLRLGLWTMPGGGVLFAAAALPFTHMVGVAVHLWLEKPLWRMARGKPAFGRKPPRPLATPQQAPAE